MKSINVKVDPLLLKEFREATAPEPLTKSIPRIMKKEIGWTEDHLEKEIERLSNTIENLVSELSDKKKNLVEQLSDKTNYLIQIDAKKLIPARHPTWENDHGIVPAFKKKGITWHFLYNHWGEF